VSGVIEPATSGRAKCRGCRQAIAKGQPRLGERMLNPYGEGEATVWFHLLCGACRRPETFAEARTEHGEELEDGAFLDRAVALGLEHRRLPRLAGVQRSPSSRARCRHCRETIAKDAWRFVLEMWEDGRFGPIGFIHVACGPGYFETHDVEHLVDRTRRLVPDLSEGDLAEIRVLLSEEGCDV
jgi:poly [ADP-ribose] polymerase